MKRNNKMGPDTIKSTSTDDSSRQVNRNSNNSLLISQKLLLPRSPKGSGRSLVQPNPNMCKQLYLVCKNQFCNTRTKNLELQPCNQRPGCKVEDHQAKSRSQSLYCTAYISERRKSRRSALELDTGKASWSRSIILRH